MHADEKRERKHDIRRRAGRILSGQQERQTDEHSDLDRDPVRTQRSDCLMCRHDDRTCNRDAGSPSLALPSTGLELAGRSVKCRRRLDGTFGALVRHVPVLEAGGIEGIFTSVDALQLLADVLRRATA
jgi:hypothetical protein